MEDELGYNPALWQLQDFNQARAHLGFELSEGAQKLAPKYDDLRIKLARKLEQKQARMAQEGNTTFQEVFSMTSLADSVKLLLWCISSSVSILLHGWHIGDYCDIAEMPQLPQLHQSQRNHPLWGSLADLLT